MYTKLKEVHSKPSCIVWNWQFVHRSNEVDTESVPYNGIPARSTPRTFNHQSRFLHAVQIATIGYDSNGQLARIPGFIKTSTAQSYEKERSFAKSFQGELPIVEINNISTLRNVCLELQ